MTPLQAEYWRRIRRSAIASLRMAEDMLGMPSSLRPEIGRPVQPAPEDSRRPAPEGRARPV